MKYTVENIVVHPFNKENLSNYFQKFFPLEQGEEFIIDTDSLFLDCPKPMIIDIECCSGYLKEKFNKGTGKVEWCVDFGIRKSKETPEGRSFIIPE